MLLVENLFRVLYEVVDDDVVELHLGDERLRPPGLGHAVHQIGAEHDGQVLRVHLVGGLGGDATQVQKEEPARDD